MKKNITVVKKEEIFQLMGITFLFIALCTSGAAIIAPLQLTDAQATIYYANSFNSTYTWMFVLIPPIVISLIVGICTTLWKLKWPSKENNIGGFW